ncbi:MAG: adenylate/guanylate cyclase domain-containing protein, partial [Gaiellales bacterium]
MRTRIWNLTTFIACLLWTAAGLSLLVLTMPSTGLPTVAQLAVLVCCTTLALVSSHARVSFQRGSQRMLVAPDAGYLVLVAMLVEPSWAALAGAVALLHSVRHAGTLLERMFLISSGALGAGAASIAAHSLFDGSRPIGREVIVAAMAAALVRAVVMLCGELLIAESRMPGGALTLLRATPLDGMLVLEVGMPIVTIAMAAPFLDRLPLALLIVIAGQLLTWRMLRMQDEQIRSELVTGELLDTFHRYVPRHVAEQILSRDGAPLDVTFDGERREITVMFVDVRGFTTWSERTDANEVFSELNSLLGELADAIITTGGTIDKFTGDGLMAFWNAPASQEDHAVRAVRTLPPLLMRVR